VKADHTIRKGGKTSTNLTLGSQKIYSFTIYTSLSKLQAKGMFGDVFPPLRTEATGIAESMGKYTVNWANEVSMSYPCQCLFFHLLRVNCEMRGLLSTNFLRKGEVFI
jgi:hypothetical protein